jgi:hypothetical protein
MQISKNRIIKMKYRLLIIGFIAFTMSFSPLYAVAQKSTDPEKPQVHRVVSTTIEATVTAINHETREVTLKVPDGKSVTVKAGSDVRNFPQIEVGDLLTVEYIGSVNIKVLAPEEAKPGAAAVTTLATAQPGQKPAGVSTQKVVVVVTITDIDLDKQLVTLKSAEGKLTTVKPRNPENLKKVKVGDRVMITYTESIAINISEKAGKK